MTKASDNVFPRFLISEGGSTATPAAGNVTMYAKADGKLYSKDDAGAETALGGSGAAATFVGVRAKRTTAQTGILTATSTVIAFNAADDIDSDAFHDTVTNNSRLTVPTGKGGKYFISGRIQWDTNTTGIRNASIKLNGTTILDEDEMSAATAPVDGRTNKVFALWTLVATDYVEMFVYQDSGGTRETRSGSAGEGTHFEMYLVGT